MPADRIPAALPLLHANYWMLRNTYPAGRSVEEPLALTLDARIKLADRSVNTIEFPATLAIFSCFYINSCVTTHTKYYRRKHTKPALRLVQRTVLVGEHSCARQTVLECERAGHDFPRSPGNYSCRHAISSVRAGPRCTASHTGFSTTLQLIFIHERTSTLLLDD